MENKKPTENRAYQRMLQAAVRRLRKRTKESIAIKSGATLCSQKESLELRSFQKKIEISLSDFSTSPVMEEWHHLLLLHYLDLADGAKETGSLITFGDLEDGLIRGVKFDRASDERLGKILKGRTLHEIETACEALDAKFVETGADLCANFQVFPKFPITLKAWLADDDFPASGKLFLQDNADHYLSVEDAVTAGEILLQKLSTLLTCRDKGRTREA